MNIRRLRELAGLPLKENDLDQVWDFINSLDPDDVGKEQIGPYLVQYEGFSPICLDDVERRIDNPDDDVTCLDDVIDEVFAEFDHVAASKGLTQVDQQVVGDSEYPIAVGIYQ